MGARSSPSSADEPERPGSGLAREFVTTGAVTGDAFRAIVRAVDGDLAFLERWRGGDKQAGEDLFGRHFAGILRFFEGKAGAKAEDLAQQTFLECVKARNQFRGDSSFRTYLYAIARNQLYGHLRRELNAVPIDFDVSSIGELGATGTSPSSRLDRARERGRLHEALTRLPAEQQLLLEYHYWHDLDAAALGEIFEVPAGTIRVRLLRARKALRDQLALLPAANVPEAEDRLTTSLVELDREELLSP